VSQETSNRYFDELTREVASGTLSRGRMLRLMGAAFLGGTLASLGLGGVAAADPPGCKRNGKTCRLDRTCCSGNCSNGQCVSDHQLRSRDFKPEHVHVRVYPCGCWRLCTQLEPKLPRLLPKPSKFWLRPARYGL
jgi:hypothetical protein